MPTRTLTIPLTSLPIGPSPIGPLNVGNNTEASLELRRDAPGGLNTLDAASHLDILVQVSTDNGATWVNKAGVSTDGGIFTTPHGTATAAQLSVGIDPAVNRVQVLVTVAGPVPIPVSGTLTVS